MGIELIRRANSNDALGIHEAHMRSIKEICSADHSPEEIQAWGGRPFDEVRRKQSIAGHSIWVVERNAVILGFAEIGFTQKGNEKTGYIYGLYLTPEIKGLGVGRRLANHMLDEAKSQGVTRLELHSTLSAHPFYLRLGFSDSGPQTTVPIAGTPIRCIPMGMILVPQAR